jgi:hypothetical protein
MNCIYHRVRGSVPPWAGEILRVGAMVANVLILARLAEFGEYACSAFIRVTTAGAPVA